MWIYSAPPLRLKGRPGMDIIWHFFTFVLLIIWGSYIAGSINLINWLIAISFGVFSLIAQVLNHINDYDFDKKSGTLTYAVWVGLGSAKTTLKISIILHMIFLIPLVVLYSLSYYLTILFIILGVACGIIFVKFKKDPLLSSIYQFPVVFGFSVYLNCVIYHISNLFEIPTLDLLPVISIIL
jgi:4-hydroxybenzoate polyprenyltransferase